MNKSDGKILIDVARKTILAVLDKKLYTPDNNTKKKFGQEQGIFVTLKKDGNLRGCIGFPLPVYPLHEAVQRAAIAAAMNDPRFPPVTKDEIKKVKIEISVLTKPEEIETEKPEDRVKKINIGKDGLIVEFGRYAGLLLPQVATENNFSQLDFLECTCQKAGLPNEIWEDRRCKVKKFSAEVFGE